MNRDDKDENDVGDDDDDDYYYEVDFDFVFDEKEDKFMFYK